MASAVSSEQCQDAGQRAGEKIAAHLEAGCESALARQQDDHHRRLRAQMHQNRPRRQRTRRRGKP